MENSHFASEAVENYLKAIYQLSCDGDGASGQDLASHVGVSGPGVTKMLRHLAKHQLVDYTPYHPVRLTELGERIALEVIRHHRLLELYLMQGLGYGWDQVHSEAERLEHHISEEFENTIERLLNYPEFDPHGDPIPTRDGHIGPHATLTLVSQEPGTRLVVRRVTDEDRELLLYLGSLGLRPGTVAELKAREPFGGSLILNVADSDVRISPEAARHVFIERLDSNRASSGMEGE